MSVKNFSNTVDLEKMGINKIKSDIFNLETVVGDEDSGLVKQVNDLDDQINDDETGLVKQINDLDDEIDVIKTLHRFYHESYEISTNPITVTFDVSELVFGLDTVIDIYPEPGVSVTSYSYSDETISVVIPAQAAAGVITLVVTNATLAA